MTPAEFAEAVVEREVLAAESGQEMMPEEKTNAFHCLGNRPSCGSAILPFEALRRENLYEEHYQ